MFIVDADPQFTHDATARVPVDGGFDDQNFKVTFRVVPADEAATYDLTNGASSAEFLRRAVVRLDDLADANKKPVPYSDALRDQLLRLSYVRQALASTYFAAIGGARLGN